MPQTEAQRRYNERRKAGKSLQQENAQLGRIKGLLEANGVALEDIGAVKAVRLSEWQAMSKDENGDPVVTDLKAASVILHPSWETGPQWPVVQPAKPVVVVPPRHTPIQVLKGWKTAVVLPDPQIGYRRLADGTLDPFHDARALDVALQIVEAERPDLSIWLGDVLDLAPMGKYRQEAGFAQTVQPAIDRAHELVAQVAALSKESRFIEGNHDARLQNYVIDNALAAFGLRRAKAKPADWPVLSVPYLLRFEELGVQYVPGYPSGATYINDNLAAIHGWKVKSGGSTAAALLADERVSVIFGHVHRIETAYKTRNSRGAPHFIAAHTPGCLCRIDGAVPSVKSGTDPFGRPSKSWEDWQQGVTVVRYTDSGLFHIESVPILEGWAMHRGQQFTSKKGVQDG